jgi:signal peptidase II
VKRYWFIGGIAVFVALLDQLTKHLAAEAIPLWHSRVVINGFFNLVHVQNRGAAFGFLNNNETAWQFWFFAGITALVAIILLYMAKTASAQMYATFCSVGLILGGAAGNFIDRFRFRHVRDFLDFYYGNWHWPAFNVADIGITCGVFWLIVLNFKDKSRPKGIDGR